MTKTDFLAQTEGSEEVFILLRSEQQSAFLEFDNENLFSKYGDYGRMVVFKYKKE